MRGRLGRGGRCDFEPDSSGLAVYVLRLLVDGAGCSTVHTTLDVYSQAFERRGKRSMMLT